MIFILLLLLGFAVTNTSTNKVHDEIYGGTDCGHAEAQYYVYVKNSMSFCGGSFLSDTWVLTAAHCLGLDLEVLIGYRDSTSQTLRRFIRAIHLPPDNQQMLNDIALLELNRPAPNVNTVHLPTRCRSTNPTRLPQQITDLHVAGWGSMGHKKMPTHLQCVTLKVQKCPRDLAAPDIFCAGDKTHRIGSGDSGGGLVFNKNGTAEVYGVAQDGSNSVYNRLLNRPNTFIDVCTHLAWIKQITHLP